MLKTCSIVSGFFLVLWLLNWSGFLPRWLLWYHLVVSVLSFVVFAWDKLMAIKQRYRVAESTLLLSALVGGWPGAWLARQLFRHKTVKQAFVKTLWGCTFLHLLLLLCVVVYQFGLL